MWWLIDTGRPGLVRWARVLVSATVAGSLAIAGLLAVGVGLHRVAGRFDERPEQAEPTAALARAREADAAAIGSCERGALQRDASTQGSVVIRVRVRGGRVHSAYLSGDTTHDAMLAECILARVNGWQVDGLSDGEQRLVFHIPRSIDP